MHRLFVAIRPPQPVRDALIDMMDDAPGARWQDEEQLHLTLRFIGEVDRHVAEDVAAALGAVHHPAFDLALAGTGVFTRRGRPATLWAGVTPHPPLKALHDKVDRACARAGIAADTRAFHPHITLARLSGGAPMPAAARAGASGPAFRVDSFALFESRLGAAGALHTIVARYPLR